MKCHLPPLVRSVPRFCCTPGTPYCAPIYKKRQRKKEGAENIANRARLGLKTSRGHVRLHLQMRALLTKRITKPGYTNLGQEPFSLCSVIFLGFLVRPVRIAHVWDYTMTKTKPSIGGISS
jgi:hypothetical protein